MDYNPIQGRQRNEKTNNETDFYRHFGGVMLLSIAPVTMAADTADDGYQKGEIIEFGSYPQSKVTDDALFRRLTTY